MEPFWQTDDTTKYWLLLKNSHLSRTNDKSSAYFIKIIAEYAVIYVGAC
jgi:hypothetical protein